MRHQGENPSYKHRVPPMRLYDYALLIEQASHQRQYKMQ